MRIGQLLSGVASGYASRAVQFAASVLLVPFLLRSDVLGLDGYGRAFTILALVALLRFAVDGMRIAFSRDVSIALGPDQQTQPGLVIGNRTKVLALACAGAAGPVALAGPLLLPAALGIEPTWESFAALCFGLMIFWSENALHLLRVPLVMQGRLSFVNACGAAEALLRALSYLVIFSIWPASLVTFFAIRAGFAFLRSLAYTIALYMRTPGVLRGFLASSWRPPRSSLRYSLPITASRTCTALVQRIPVIAANVSLGAEASGLVALVMNTTRQYVIDTLFSVLRPLAVPIASRLDPRQLSTRSADFLWRLERLYIMSTTVVIAGAMTVTSELFLFWLGSGYESVILPAQLMLAGCCVEIAYRVREAILVGRGLIADTIPLVLGLGAASLVGVFLSATQWETWQGMIAFAAAFFAGAGALGIGVAFSRSFGRAVAVSPPVLGPPVFLFGSLALAAALSSWRPLPGVAGAGASLVVVGIGVAVVGHFALMKLPTTLSTVNSLRRHTHRDIFSWPIPSRGGGEA